MYYSLGATWVPVLASWQYAYYYRFLPYDSFLSPVIVCAVYPAARRPSPFVNHRTLSHAVYHEVSYTKMMLDWKVTILYFLCTGVNHLIFYWFHCLIMGSSTRHIVIGQPLFSAEMTGRADCVRRGARERFVYSTRCPKTIFALLPMKVWYDARQPHCLTGTYTEGGETS